MKKIRKGYILPSAAWTIEPARICYYGKKTGAPQVGDLVYGSVTYIGQHSSLENKEGRIHIINQGSRAIFVFGHRYAPDYYEGKVPEAYGAEVDMLARSGVVGQMLCKNANIKDPTRVSLLGYVFDENRQPLNTLRFNRIRPRTREKKPNRARLILHIGTSMNSGKSMSAAACCWALSSLGHTVRGAKITGTASLKDILHMEDCGAHPVADFSHLGYPSTYLASREQLLEIFNRMDLKFANSPRNYWVVEIADGILQRETAILLEAPEVRSRIHRLIFSANDAFGAIGGLKVLKERFDLVPDAISGVCSSSPLSIRELREYTELPIFNNVRRELDQIAPLVV